MWASRVSAAMLSLVTPSFRVGLAVEVAACPHGTNADLFERWSERSKPLRDGLPIYGQSWDGSQEVFFGERRRIVMSGIGESGREKDVEKSTRLTDRAALLQEDTFLEHGRHEVKFALSLPAFGIGFETIAVHFPPFDTSIYRYFSLMS
jgi:hypothetical protein